MKKILLVVLLSIASIITQAQESFKKGHYYTHEGIKVEGFLRCLDARMSILGNVPASIKFKESLSSYKSKHLKIDQVSSFVIEKDTFATIGAISVSPTWGNFPKSFAQIYITGPMNMGVHRSSSTSNVAVSYYTTLILFKDSSAYLAVTNIKKQKVELLKLFQDVPFVQSKLINMEMQLEDLPNLVIEYNTLIAKKDL
ncbi:hypothetical protein [Sabulibacter ruber]|uniref:hypothetical protein n=1 Tax=Sabulibacter ruber TaxID=2811901 RepID=UPI001A975D1B|nr:hypothetical protein [Sabulibacter ruber]